MGGWVDAKVDWGEVVGDVALAEVHVFAIPHSSERMPLAPHPAALLPSPTPAPVSLSCFLFLSPCCLQDHKAVGEGDTGLNTGGMGSYSPAPVLTPEIERQAMEELVYPTARGMCAEGTPFRGVLFAGLMIKDGKVGVGVSVGGWVGVGRWVSVDGRGRAGGRAACVEGQLAARLARGSMQTCQLRRAVPNQPASAAPCGVQATLLEHNVRFGDPECQSLMVRLQSDLLESLLAQCRGEDVKLDWSADPSLTVVLAAKGYPGPYAKGGAIHNLEAVTGAKVFHAGTAMKDGQVVSTGGRVLGVTATGKDVLEAQQKAYAAVDAIDFPDGFCRRDIGWRAVARLREQQQR